MDSADDAEVIDNSAQRRYEVYVGGELAGFLQYRVRVGRLVVTHTEVDPAFGGRGLGGALAHAVLTAAREHGQVVVPLCPFVSAYIRKHPEYIDLVAGDYRADVQP